MAEENDEYARIRAERLRKLREASAARKSDYKSMFDTVRANKTSLLGKGAFGSVRRVKNDTRSYALKRVIFDEAAKKENNISPGPVEYFNREVNILQGLRGNPYVVQIFGSEKSAENAYLLTELLEHGMPLSSAADELALLSLDEIKKVVANLVRGLESIHARGYLHLDIKPENIWYYPDDFTIKYLDFGIACKMPCMRDTFAGTRKYMPKPFVSAGKFIFDKTNDFYALGKTLEDIEEIVDAELRDYIKDVKTRVFALTDSENATDVLTASAGGKRRKTRRRRIAM